MPQIAPLSPTYSTARAAFLEGADAAGAAVATTVHPHRGLEGEALAVDVASLGPADAAHVVAAFSATHGVEGYCGSALQRHWLAHHAGELPEGVRLHMVHALNPYGMSWVRRVNEDNVDLNRNFVDWEAPVPDNPEYTSIADLLVPADWSDDEQQRTTNELLALAAEWGFPKLQAVVSGGQYHHATGVFYGGTGPVWSHRWLREWSAVAFAQAEQVTIIDVHTGLGPWGHGELIGGGAPGDALYERALRRWPDTRSMLAGDSVSAVLAGDWVNASAELAPHAEVTPVCIEYGTVDPVTVLQSLRADAWLHGHGEPLGPQGPGVRAQVRAAFADDNPEWIAACWPRFHDVLAATFDAA